MCWKWKRKYMEAVDVFTAGLYFMQAFHSPIEVMKCNGSLFLMFMFCIQWLWPEMHVLMSNP